MKKSSIILITVGVIIAVIILSLIGRNLRAFKDLPDYIFFERTYEFVKKHLNNNIFAHLICKRIIYSKKLLF